MKILRSHKNSAGVAILEAAACTVVLVMFGFGAVGLCSYLNQLQNLRNAVDEVVISTGARPFQISSTADGGAQLMLNTSALDGFLDRSVAVLKERISADSRSSIEVGYAVAKIDSRTGAFAGFDLSSGSAKSAGTGRSLPSECPELPRMFATFAAAEPESGRSRSAVPSGGFGIEGASYLPRSVFIGVRVIRDLSGDGIEALFSGLGGPRTISSCKVQVLRGEVE